MHVDMMAYMRMFIYSVMDAQHTCNHMYMLPKQLRFAAPTPPPPLHFCVCRLFCARFSRSALLVSPTWCVDFVWRIAVPFQPERFVGEELHAGITTRSCANELIGISFLRSFTKWGGFTGGHSVPLVAAPCVASSIQNGKCPMLHTHVRM